MIKCTMFFVMHETIALSSLLLRTLLVRRIMRSPGLEESSGSTLSSLLCSSNCTINECYSSCSLANFSMMLDVSIK